MISHPPPAATERFALEVSPAREWVVIAPQGELDLATVPVLERTVGSLLDTGFDALRIDLRGLTFADSTVVHFLLELSRREELRLELIPARSPVQRVFSISEAEPHLPFA